MAVDDGKAAAPLPPPPFMSFPFSPIRPPPFWPMQEHHPHHFFGAKSFPANAQFAAADPHSSPQVLGVAPVHEGRAGGGVAAAQFVSRNFLPSSVSAQSPVAPGLQLFTESPESCLLDPQTASPPPPQSMKPHATPAEVPRFGSRAQSEQGFTGVGVAAAAAAAAGLKQSGGLQAVMMYPSPLASHDEVLADRRLFYDTLAKLHAVLALQPRVPKLDGKELDLHTLYREVTARGGLKQVVKLNSWKDVMAVLDLPSRVSSFFIRKHYTNLLYHYEQVYYFKAQGEIIPSPAPLPTPSPVTSQINDSLKPPVVEESVPTKRKKKLGIFESFEVDPGKSVGRSVTGAIEGKFEHGYLVTVVVGKEKMRGVLYHVPSGSEIPQFAALPELMNKLSSPQTPADSRLGIHHPKSKNGDYFKDPDAPKSSRSGYNFFFAEQRTKMKGYHPEKHTEITKMIGELWRKLTPEERMPYLQRGQRDKERYQSEKKEYQDKSKMLAELRDENTLCARLESLDEPGQGPEQLGRDGDTEFGVANDSEHDYHVSLDPDLDGAGFHHSQEQGIQIQSFCDYVPDQLENSHDHAYQLAEQADGQQHEVFADHPEGYEEDGVEEEADLNDDDGNNDDIYDDGGDAVKNGDNAQVGQAQGF